MEERIDRIEKAIEEIIKGYERHDKILANLEANQIVIGKAMDSIKEDVGRIVKAVNEFMYVVGYKLRDHENRIDKLEGK